MERPDSSRLIIVGVVLAFLFLIGAVWASDASVAASLALTGGILLVGVGTIVTIMPASAPRSPADDQRDRMKQTTP
jgi:flagellar motor component MotA